MTIESKKNKESERILKLLAAEVTVRQKLWYLIWRQFLIGVAYGLGASIGAAIIGGALIYVYRNIFDNFF